MAARRRRQGDDGMTRLEYWTLILFVTTSPVLSDRWRAITAWTAAAGALIAIMREAIA
jgi:hypothetical protein